MITVTEQLTKEIAKLSHKYITSNPSMTPDDIFHLMLDETGIADDEDMAIRWYSNTPEATPLADAVKELYGDFNLGYDPLMATFHVFLSWIFNFAYEAIQNQQKGKQL